MSWSCSVRRRLLIVFCYLVTVVDSGPVSLVTRNKNDIVLGKCIWVVDRECPDPDIKFYLFTSKNPNDRQLIHASDTWEKSNLSSSHFDPDHATKVIMHGFNSDMYLTSLIDMKDEYLARGNYNLFYIDYSDLARGPCYVQAVHNLRFVGRCLGLLLDRILETGTRDIHLIGFSLGAQLANFASIAIRPYTVNRITGLDPAMPLYVGVPKDDRLDATDAKFVDVYHTNAFVQGKVEQCGDVDFYFNGGIIQPGCTSWKDNPVGCSHNRAPMYFMESVRSFEGFWAWPCKSYVMYLLRMCPPSNNMLIVAGEDIRTSSRGMHFLNTHPEAPFAMGRGSTSNRFRQQPNDFMVPATRRDPLLEEIDQWGKLDGAFNNIDQFPTPLPQDPMEDEWNYFGQQGPSQISQQNNYYYAPSSDDKSGGRGGEAGDSVGPYGIQVLDVLHRTHSPTKDNHSHKHSGRRRPQRNRVRTRTRTSANATAEHSQHLIQKLWEDFNSLESTRAEVSLDAPPAPAIPYWRRRQVYSAMDSDQLYQLPSMRKDSQEAATKGAKDDVEEEEGVVEEEEKLVPTRQLKLRTGH